MRNKRKRKCDVFVSYRRDGGEMTALHISQELKHRKYNVFFDRESLRTPGHFNSALKEYIRSCKDFVLILSPQALERCESKKDWVRIELEEAMKHGKNIVPVMMDGFAYPEVLPESIEDIRYIQAVAPSMDYFAESMDRLCEGFLMSKPRGYGKWIAAAALCVLLAAGGIFAGSKLWKIIVPDPANDVVVVSDDLETAGVDVPELSATDMPELTDTLEPTDTPAPTEIPVDVRGSIEASAQIVVKNVEGDWVEKRTNAAMPLDLGEYPEGFYYSPRLTIKNTSNQDVSYSLRVMVDGRELKWDGERTCEAKGSQSYYIGAAGFKDSLTTGIHTCTWYVNDYVLMTYTFEFTNEKRADLRDSLSAVTFLDIYDADGRFLYSTNQTVGNLRELPEGAHYVPVLSIENLSAEAKEIYLARIDQDGRTAFWDVRTYEPNASKSSNNNLFEQDVGEHTFMWYVNGYPILTQTYTITDEPLEDVTGSLAATPKIRLRGNDGSDRGHLTADIFDVARDVPANGYASYALSIKNTSSQKLTLSVRLVVDKEAYNRTMTIGAGAMDEVWFSAEDMLRHMSAGEHTCDWYINGRLALSQTYTIADSSDAMREIEEMKEKALAGDAEMAHKLGISYYAGSDGADKDPEEGLRWYVLAAELGDVNATKQLADKYKNGNGAEPDYQKALAYYEQAAKQNELSAAYQAAWMYYDSTYGMQDYAKAQEYFQLVAANPTAADCQSANYELGRMYHNGYGMDAPDYPKALEYFKQAGPDGYNWLGWYYEGSVDGIEKDYSEAIKWYKLKAEANDSTDDYAMNGIGKCYLYGGNEEEYPLAVEWFTKAAELGNNYAMYELYRCYLHGWGVDADEAVAAEWLQKAADAGNEGAKKELLEKDSSEASELKKLEAQAQGGDAEAAEQLADKYKNGDGVEQDYQKALAYYEQAAGLGNLHAAYQAAMMQYINTYGMQDYAKAQEYFQLVAADPTAADYQSANYELGRIYHNGYGMDAPDYPKAREYFKQAGPDGYDWLGMYYEGKYGFEKDYAEAIKWYKLKAEEEGSTDDYAMNGIGKCYLYGGNKEEYPLAVEWFTKAAELGNNYAMYELYRCYLHGWGVDVDKAVAAEWLQKAADAGNETAKKVLLESED